MYIPEVSLPLDGFLGFTSKIIVEIKTRIVTKFILYEQINFPQWFYHNDPFLAPHVESRAILIVKHDTDISSR